MFANHSDNGRLGGCLVWAEEGGGMLVKDGSAGGLDGGIVEVVGLAVLQEPTEVERDGVRGCRKRLTWRLACGTPGDEARPG